MKILLTYLKNNPEVVEVFVSTLVRGLTFVLFSAVMISAAVVGAWGVFSLCLSLLMLRAWLLYRVAKRKVALVSEISKNLAEALEKNVIHGVTPSYN